MVSIDVRVKNDQMRFHKTEKSENESLMRVSYHQLVLTILAYKLNSEQNVYNNIKKIHKLYCK